MSGIRLGSVYTTEYGIVYNTEYFAALWMYSVVTIICVDSVYTLSLCKKEVRWSINGTGIMGWGLGHFVFFEHFCFFFRSLALVFQKSPTRNKEATRFTVIENIFQHKLMYTSIRKLSVTTN